MATTVTTVDQVDYDAEIRRVAVELQAFPFIPRKLNFSKRARKGIRVFGGYLLRETYGAHGAFVYHDIISDGGTGTRRQVLRTIESMILMRWQPNTVNPVLVGPTPPAVDRVVRKRVIAPTTVSTPEVPLAAAAYWSALPLPTPDYLENAERLGTTGILWLRHLEWLDVSDDMRVEVLRRAWHYALLAMEDDTLAWCAEQEQLQEFARTLHGSLRSTAVIVRPTRLITLEE